MIISVLGNMFYDVHETVLHDSINQEQELLLDFHLLLDPINSTHFHPATHFHLAPLFQLDCTAKENYIVVINMKSLLCTAAQLTEVL